MMMMMRARPWIRLLRWAGILAAATTILTTHIHALVAPVPPLQQQQHPLADRRTRSAVSRTTFPANLVRTLDLSLVLARVADHCGTRRGRIGLLRHADPTAGGMNGVTRPGEGRRRRRLWTTNVDNNDNDDDNPVSTIARSPEEAIELWRYVEAAAQSIQQHQDWPPFYPKEGPLDTSAAETVVTDDDEWLQYGSVDEFTLQDIWQAEQVIARLIQVHEWMEAHPIFNAVRTMDVVALEQAREAIRGTVSITKLRSVTGTSASYTFALNQATKFPVLALLQRRGVPEEELEAKQTEIRHGLALRLLSVFAAIDDALNTAAWLDVIFAKAAFGLCRITGDSSTVVGPHCHRHDDNDANSDSSKFEVRAFQHPLLLDGVAVPTDLLLGGEQHCSSLVISGPNGGGKSLTLKSFGLLAVLYKVAIPLAIPDGQHNPSIPFYHTISVSLGDAQSIQDGESTFTAKLNEYSRTLSLLREDSSALSLILLDELGAGTDESSGGCIGQAIIEELSQLNCHVVATTHASRLKTFAYSSDSVAAASVVLDSETGKPAYRLAYNTVGQANALSALRRSNPPFPESFLVKTQGLMAESNDDTASRYITALTESLSSLNDEAETEKRAAQVIRKAIAQLAASYADHLTKLEYKLDRDYLELLRKQKAGELDSIAVIGNSLSEVRLVRQAIETESDLLRKQGLKKVSVSYEFRIGETAVVVDELSPWHGESVQIVATEIGDMVRVAAVDGLVAAFEPTSSQLFGRHQLAVWDYDSVWNDDDDEVSSAVTPAVPLARRRVNTVLASIDAAVGTRDRPPTTQRTGGAAATTNGVAQKAPRFQSSRERKSAKRQKPRK
jgi:hypothetical protein